MDRSKGSDRHDQHLTTTMIYSYAGIGSMYHRPVRYENLGIQAKSLRKGVNPFRLIGDLKTLPRKMRAQYASAPFEMPGVFKQ